MNPFDPVTRLKALQVLKYAWRKCATRNIGRRIFCKKSIKITNFS